MALLFGNILLNTGVPMTMVLVWVSRLITDLLTATTDPDGVKALTPIRRSYV